MPLAGLFGLIFSGFAAIGKPHYTFALNGVCFNLILSGSTCPETNDLQAAAIVAFLVMLFARFPPEGATRCKDDDTESEEQPLTS